MSKIKCAAIIRRYVSLACLLSAVLVIAWNAPVCAATSAIPVQQQQGTDIEAIRAQIIEQLRSDDVSEKVDAATQIARTPDGLIFRVVIPDLIAALESDEEALAIAAVEALGSIGEAATREKVALPEMAPALPIVLESLTDDMQHSQIPAIIAIPKIARHCDDASVEKVVKKLMLIMDSAERETSLRAIGALGDLGPAASRAVPALVEMLKSDLAKLHFAADSIGKIAFDAELCVPALMHGHDRMGATALGSVNEYARMRTLMAIAAFGPDAADATEWLLPILYDESDLIRKSALIALERIGPSDADSVREIAAAKYAFSDAQVYLTAFEFGLPQINAQSVIDDLGSDDWRVQIRAIECAAKMPWPLDLRPAIPEIVNLLSSENERFVSLSVATIRSIANCANRCEVLIPELDTAIDALLKYREPVPNGPLVLVNNEPMASQTLGAVAKCAGHESVQRILPALVEAINSSNIDAQYTALVALGEIGPNASSAVPAIVAQLKISMSADAAAMVLWNIRSQPELCVPVLRRKLAEHMNEGTLSESHGMLLIDAIGAFGPDSAEAVPELTALLESKIVLLQTKAAYALAQIGTAAEPAIPSLEVTFQEVRDDDQYASSWFFVAICAVEENAQVRGKALALDFTEFQFEWPDRRLGLLGRSVSPPIYKNPMRLVPISVIDGSVVTGQVLNVLSHAGQLTQLDMGICGMNDENFVQLQQLVHLTDLVLPITTTDEQFKLFASMNCSGFKSLQIGKDVPSDPLITTRRAKLLGIATLSDNGMEQLRYFGDLQSLQLPLCRVSDDGLQHLKNCPSLSKLEIASPLMTDEGIRHLACLKNLVDLSLRTTGIGDAGIARLVQQNPGLRSLDLQYTAITPECISALVQLNDLEILNISNTQIAGSGSNQNYRSKALTDVILALPNCRVLFR